MKMIQATSLNSSAVIPFQATNEPLPETTAGTYDAVRFNAMKHGILSRLALQEHEDGTTQPADGSRLERSVRR